MKLDRLQLFFGDSSAAQARIYALLPADAAAAAGCTLSGVVTGPRCALAQTLDATAPLVDRGCAPADGGASLVAEALVTDPCFWSPELPMLYHVRVQLRRAGEVLATVEQPLGIRPLGTRGRRLLLHARRCVLRGVHRDEVPRSPLLQWREADAALVVDTPEEDLCREASQLGVLLIARLRNSAAELGATVRRLGRWPAVVVIVLDTSNETSRMAKFEARNVLFAQHFGAGETVEPAPWADLAVCQDADSPALAARAAACPKPVFALRRAGKQASVAAARGECDALQRDLAGRGDFAGYIV